LTVEVGVLESKQATYEENRVKLLSLLNETAAEIGVSLSSEPDQSDLDKFRLQFSNYLESFRAQTALVERQQRAAEHEIQAKIEKERDAKSKIHQNIDTKTELIDKSRQQLAKIDQELSAVPDDNIMRSLTRDIEACEGIVVAA
jgi:hypothetical protein